MRHIIAVAVLTVGLVACGQKKVVPERKSFNDMFGETISEQAKRQQQLQFDITERTKTCLRAAGFQVQAADPNQPDSWAAITQMKDEQFVSQYGYGVALEATRSLLHVEKDPIVVFRNALAEQERAAFDSALRGSQGEVGAGCLAKAESEALDGLVALRAARVELEEKIKADPRHRVVEEKFVACMKQASFVDATNFLWGREAVKKKAQEAMLLAKVFFVDGTEGLLSSADGSKPIARVVIPEAFQEVQVFEQRVARADVDCRKPLQAEIEAVRHPYEEEFVKTH
jgi:hypothetical protein